MFMLSRVYVAQHYIICMFLAPTGAQEMQIFVRSSVCSMKVCLEFTIFIFWPQILQDDFRMTSG